MTTLERYDALVEKYIHMAKRNNLTETTISNYNSVTHLLRDFLQIRSDAGIIGDGYVSYDDIQAWIDYMIDNGNKVSTVKQRLVTAAQLFTFATKPYIPADIRYNASPISPDFYPKVPTENIPEALTDDEIIGLWEYKRKYKASEANFARNYAIVALILTTGLRNKEVLDLTLDSISLDSGEIFVSNGKGRKTRIVDMDNGADGLCAAALENYLRVGDRPKNIPDSAPLFGTTAAHTFGEINTSEDAESYHRGTTAWLSQLVQRHIENQVGRGGCRTHDLRHTFARLSLNSTGNLAELQSALGHNSPLVTERYSGRLLAKRARESARAVLAARDEAAEKMKRENDKQMKIVALGA